MTASPNPGRPAVRDAKGRITQPATISCTMPQVLAGLRPEEPIWFDDGKIGGVIEKVTPEGVTVRITVGAAGG